MTQHGLSLLDVAKHGVRTIIKTLSDMDRLSLVAFQTNATTILPLTRMDEAGVLADLAGAVAPGHVEERVL